MAKKEEQLDLLAVDKGNYGRGGKRVGAGRKKGSGSKLIRVPSELVEEVESLIAIHRGNKNV